MSQNILIPLVDEYNDLQSATIKVTAFFTEQRLRLSNLQIHASMICRCSRLKRSLTDWKKESLR